MKSIQIEHLTIVFAEKNIIEDFSATIDAGKFVGVFGPNGAGKSTLLRAILGLIKPNQGKMIILDKPARRGHPDIGYLSQFRQYASSNLLTTRCYLSSVYHGGHWGLPTHSQQEKEQIEKVITLTHIEKFIDQPYLSLSGGERQRVALAQALIGQPKILLLDEPLSGLDPAQQEKMVHLVQEIQQQMQMTVLFTAHDMNPLLGVMDQIIYLAHGRAAVGGIDEVVNSEKLSWLYDTPIKIIRQDSHLLVIHEKLGSNLHAHDHPFC